MALGVPGKLRPRIFSTFGTTRVVGRQPNAPATFTPGEIPGTHFQWLNRPQGTWFCRKEPRKKSQVAPPGINPGTVRLFLPSKSAFCCFRILWLIKEIHGNIQSFKVMISGYFSKKKTVYFKPRYSVFFFSRSERVVTDVAFVFLLRWPWL